MSAGEAPPGGGSGRRSGLMPVSRRLLARIRQVMAGHDPAQSKLDQTAEIIALEMVAEVCSIYLRRAGDVLELFATKGLKAEAVHQTRLRVGEGLIGEIAALARPVALEDAGSHPNFAYRPETGEEIYSSLMGVPILRGGRVTGVVAVQNKTKRMYTEEEVEILQTVAMVLAEMATRSDVVAAEELLPVDGIALKPLRLDGLTLNAGVGFGTTVLHAPHLTVETVVADDPETERERLHTAFKDMHGAIDDLLASDALAGGGEHRDVLETYRLIAKDSGWLARIEEAIENGLTAEAAVQRVQNELRARMSKIDDAYLRERVHDLDDLGHRLAQHLAGAYRPPGDLPDHVVLVARSMGPAQLLDYDHERLRGLVLEEGSPNAHVAIVARALDIPVVGRVGGLLERIEEGETMIVDGDNAQIFVRPSDDVIDTFKTSVRLRAAARAEYAELKKQPAETRDGVAISLNINAGLRIDLKHLAETNADGIGLFRTEIPFMTESRAPNVTRQAEIYRTVLEGAGERPVVFRTLDAGGDKALPYWDMGAEENPSMGWRAIRVSLDRPVMMRQQLRALIRAGAGRALNIMFPMIAEVAEFDAARALLERELASEEKRGGEPPSAVKIGAMLEVPALAFQLGALVERADFLSVGSNDMLQFLFASDRGNPRMAGRYDALSPSVIAFLRSVVEACENSDTELSLCGEMAGKPLEAMALMGIGFRRISMAASAIGPVKAMVRSVRLDDLTAYMDTLRDQPDHSLRQKLKAFAQDHGVRV